MTESLSRYTDEQWVALLVRSIREEIIDGLKFPKFPSDELQSQFVGSSNKRALREAFYFYRFFKETSARSGNVFNASKKALDFGTGWGRYLRFLWKDFGAENIVGLDVDPDVLEVARNNGVPGKLLRIAPDGQMPLDNGSINVAIAYSVFTHLPEGLHRRWADEFKRVIAPGGTIGITTEPRRFLLFVAGLEGKEVESGWHAGLQKFSRYAAANLATFDSGELVYLPTGGGDHREATVYGDAVCPLPFLRRLWEPEFEMLEYVDDPSRFWQAAIVMKRR